MHPSTGSYSLSLYSVTRLMDHHPSSTAKTGINSSPPVVKKLDSASPAKLASAGCRRLGTQRRTSWDPDETSKGGKQSVGTDGCSYDYMVNGLNCLSSCSLFCHVFTPQRLIFSYTSTPFDSPYWSTTSPLYVRVKDYNDEEATSFWRFWSRDI